MPKDPVCGMSVDKEGGFKFRSAQGEDYFFCSKHCMEKFKTLNSGGCCAGKSVFYRNKTFIAAAVVIFIIFISYFFVFLAPLRKSLLSYMGAMWPAVLSGIVLGGAIDYYIPRHYISYILSRPKKRTIVYAVFLGFLMSACSHGILALAIALHKKGASNSAVAAFLLASPWANMPLTFMLITFFGLGGLFIIFSAIVVALTTGFIFQFLEKKELVEKNANTSEVEDNFSIILDIKRRAGGYKLSFKTLQNDIAGIFNSAFSLADMILWWIIIGVGLAGITGAYVPGHIFRHYMGPGILGLFTTLLAATVIEVCSEGSAPIAFEIFKQTGALGNSFVFLMAGVVTDYTEIGLLWHNVGKRVAIWFVVLSVPQVVAIGWAANLFFR